ncbi:MAG: hypothetical protein NC191_10435 [Muribaculaceae bacterium]|nr:hypothetical protein [Muribaculaceae bacterium]
MFNPSFNGYLRFTEPNLRFFIHIQEQKLDKKGKVVARFPVDNLIINTDQIVGINSKTSSPMGADKITENIYIDMANGSRYAIADQDRLLIENKLEEAINNPSRIVDVFA